MHPGSCSAQNPRDRSNLESTQLLRFSFVLPALFVDKEHQLSHCLAHSGIPLICGSESWPTLDMPQLEHFHTACRNHLALISPLQGLFHLPFLLVICVATIVQTNTAVIVFWPSDYENPLNLLSSSSSLLGSRAGV